MTTYSVFNTVVFAENKFILSNDYLNELFLSIETQILIILDAISNSTNNTSEHIDEMKNLVSEANVEIERYFSDSQIQMNEFTYERYEFKEISLIELDETKNEIEIHHLEAFLEQVRFMRKTRMYSIAFKNFFEDEVLRRLSKFTRMYAY